MLDYTANTCQEMAFYFISKMATDSYWKNHLQHGTNNCVDSKEKIELEERWNYMEKWGSNIYRSYTGTRWNEARIQARNKKEQIIFDFIYKNNLVEQKGY